MTTPLKNFIAKSHPAGNITQWFGESPTLYKHICYAGFGCMQGHNGVDIVAPWGTPIYAVEEGIVADVKDTPGGYGKHIRIFSPTKNGTGNEWTYGHASQNLVQIGDTVEEGQMIQLMGNTGFVVSGPTPFWKKNPYAGTHLHLGCRKYRPTADGFSYNAGTPTIEFLDQRNGFFGSVDFRKELEAAEGVIGTRRQKLLTIKSLANHLLSLIKAT